MNQMKAWKAFRSGDPLSNAELVSLLKLTREVEKGLVILGETGGVLFKLRLDIQSLEGFQQARRSGVSTDNS